MRRPHCASNWLPKYGRSNGRQSYRCEDCFYKFTPGGNRSYYSEAVKKQAVEMYCEGSAVAAISRVLGVKAGTVGLWGKKVRQSMSVVDTERSLRADADVKIISFDEMWTYVCAGVRGAQRGYGLRWWRKRTAAGGWTMRWEVVMSGHS